ncbi:hypothetical protein ACO11K_002303 [Bacillus cytotoxicus]|nr:hypothetical protein [Bacillus cytotoxicus]
MLNEENRGVKLVGALSLIHYANGLKQVLNVKALRPKQQSALPHLLEKEILGEACFIK